MSGIIHGNFAHALINSDSFSQINGPFILMNSQYKINKQWLAITVITTAIFSIIWPSLAIVLYAVMSLFDKYKGIFTRVWNWENISDLILQGALGGALLGLTFGAFDIMFDFFSSKRQD